MQVVISGKPLRGIGLRLDAVYERGMQITWSTRSINRFVTSQPVSKSLRVVMQVLTSGKPFRSIAREFDAFYQREMQVT